MDSLNLLRFWINGIDQRTGAGPIERPKTISTDGSGILSPFFLFSNSEKITPKHKQTLEWEYFYSHLEVLNITLRSILRTHIKEMQIIHHISLDKEKNYDLYILISGTSDIDFLYSKIFKKEIFLPKEEHLYYDLGLNLYKFNILPQEFAEIYKELGSI
jgi:hypothetical protein